MLIPVTLLLQNYTPEHVYEARMYSVPRKDEKVEMSGRVYIVSDVRHVFDESGNPHINVCLRAYRDN